MRSMFDIKWSNELTTEATKLPLTLEDLRNHSRISDNASDEHLNDTLLAAVRYCETIQKRSYMLKTFTLRMDRFPWEIVLPMPPLSSVTSINYLDSGGTSQTLATDQYQVDLAGDPGRIKPATTVGVWPVTRAGAYNAVTVVYVAGYPIAAQETRVTPTAVEIGDVFNILIDGEVIATFTAVATTVASVVTGLVADFIYPKIVATDETNHMKLLGTPGFPFGVTGGTVDGGSLDTQFVSIETVTPTPSVPQDVRHALRLLVEHWDVNREPIIVGTINQQLAHTVRDLLAGGKVYRFP